MTVAELKKGVPRVVQHIEDVDLAENLAELGIFPGEVISVKRRAPFGDPIILLAGGSKISIRKSDAKKVITAAVV